MQQLQPNIERQGVTSLAYSPGMALIASGCTDLKVRIWDFDRLQPQPEAVLTGFEKV